MTNETKSIIKLISRFLKNREFTILINKDKLIVMVTHNPELAEKDLTRIVKLVDGKITTDSNPIKEKEKIEIRKDFKLKNKKT